jgi:hypothetical protein
VAKEIMSPNVTESLGSGWRYSGSGDKISFIILDEDPNFVKVTFQGNEILIWKKQKDRRTVWFFCDKICGITELNEESTSAAIKFWIFAHKRHESKPTPDSATKPVPKMDKQTAKAKIKRTRDKLRHLHPETV